MSVPVLPLLVVLRSACWPLNPPGFGPTSATHATADSKLALSNPDFNEAIRCDRMGVFVGDLIAGIALVLIICLACYVRGSIRARYLIDVSSCANIASLCTMPLCASFTCPLFSALSAIACSCNHRQSWLCTGLFDGGLPDSKLLLLLCYRATSLHHRSAVPAE